MSTSHKLASVLVLFVLCVVALIAGLGLNKRVDRQRDLLCATVPNAQATLKDCPDKRIQQLEQELKKLRGKP